MSQLSGSVTVELDLDKLADTIALRLASVLAVDQLADRVAARVAVMLAQPAGSDQYVREPEPEPGAGGRVRRGARSGGVVDGGHLEYDDDPPGGSRDQLTGGGAA